MFYVFTANVHFNQHLQRRHGFRPLIAQAAGDFFAVDGVHPMSTFGGNAAFIGLDMADDVPADVGNIGQLAAFLFKFLQIVFAEIALRTFLAQQAHIGGGKGFAHRNQLGLGAACHFGGSPNAGAHGVQVHGQHSHHFSFSSNNPPGILHTGMGWILCSVARCRRW